MAHILGLDIGTSSAKLALVDEALRVSYQAVEPLRVNIPSPGWSEQSPSDWWAACVRLLKGCASFLREQGFSIDCIALTGQMHGLVALDKALEPIRDAMLWNDARAAGEVEFLKLHHLDDITDRTQNPVLEGYTLPKLLWMQYHERDAFDRMTHFLLPKDYVRFRMTGALCTDPTDASGTGIYDIRRRSWLKALGRSLGLAQTVYPDVVRSGEVAGFVSREAAMLTGIPKGTPVVTGAGDSVCQARGVGACDPSRTCVGIGTSGVATKLANEIAHPGRLQCYATDTDGIYQVTGCQINSGSAYARMVEFLCPGLSFGECDALAEASAPGANGLFLVPYFMGERCPYADSFARGTLAGLDAASTRGDALRACLEGVAFGMREILDLLEPGDSRLSEVIVSGGVLRSSLWTGILVDVLHRPVRIVRNAEFAAPVGASMYAGLGVGIWKDWKEASDLIGEGEQMVPGKNAELYDMRFRLYGTLYPRVRPLYRKMGDGIQEEYAPEADEPYSPTEGAKNIKFVWR